MYVITRFDSIFSCPVLGTYSTQEEALEHLRALKTQFIEEDAQNPGCYDAIGSDGRIYSIEKKD